MAIFELNDNIFIEKIDEKKDSNVIVKKTITFKKPIILQLNTKNKELSIDAYTDDQYDAKYLEGLIEYEYPIYININNSKYGKFYGIIKNVSINREQAGFYEIKIDVERINSDYSYVIKSKKEWIPNDLVDENEIQPCIVVPKGAKVLYNGIVPKTEGLVDIYETDSVELIEPIPTTMIKIYDDMNTTDESKWKLVSKPEEHEFVGDCWIEFGNLRVTFGHGELYTFNGSEWINVGAVGFTYGSYIDNAALYTEKINHKNAKKHFNGNKLIIYQDYYRDNLHPIQTFENIYVFNNEVIYYYGTGTRSTPIYPGNSIIVNSDYKVRTFDLETQGVYSGSNGWCFVYRKDIDYPFVIFTSEPNVKLYRNDTYVYNSSQDKYVYPLVNYVNRLFNEAENAGIGKGTIVEDNDAFGGYAVQGTGDNIDIHFFNSKYNIPMDWQLPTGNYKAICRIKANTTSPNDKVEFRLWNYTTNTTEVVNIFSAKDIGTSYNYISLDFTYNGTDDINIQLYKNKNVDGTLFNVDYAIIVPVSEIESIQKRVFCDNNQKLQVIPKEI